MFPPLVLAVVLAATTAETPAPASPAAPAAQAVAAKTPDAGKMICTTEIPIGTRFPKKVCRSAASVEEIGRTEREAIQAAQRGYSQCGQASNTRC